ncbi:MAG: purine-nucleoside phosphorylase [Actinobacteria bacterium]|nr:purine-nucleoside phosphorylase [Chloroflexota bacterium]MBE3128599.1 purine-nucleoside phosphorylase [Actinomycetota bacterium]
MSKSAFPGKEKLKETCNYLSFYIPEKIDFGLILGSFLNRCIDFLPLQSKITLNISDIPHMSVPSISGHGKFIVYGKLENKNILIFSGRLHLYEGYDIKEVVYPVNLLSNLSTDNLIITNSAGGINPGFTEDDIMIIKDHINLMFDNPFFGNKYSRQHDYFVDMSCPYDKKLSGIAKEAGEGIGFKLKTGVYAGVKGPVLETNAEIDMLGKLGADAVGMSTVPEVIMANYLKIKVLGLSHIRNIKRSNQPEFENKNKEKKFSHSDGFKKEIFIGKRFANLIEIILKKA